MRLFLLFLTALLGKQDAAAAAAAAAVADDPQQHSGFRADQFVFTELPDVKLPKPLSDFTATKDETTGLTYLAGGCDALTGNQYSEEIKEFICATTSNQLYVFDQETLSFTELAEMPVQRYRHGAALVNGHLWLFGGRDAEMDALLPTLDVYSIADDTWQSYDISQMENNGQAQLLRSDNGGFADPATGIAYFVGGYDPIYGFLDSVFAVDTAATLATNTVVTVPKAPLLIARGDLTAVANADHTRAIVTGGFGPTQEFCEPLLEVEQYDFATDTWTRLANLNHGRGDKALVSFQNLFFAMGGERQIHGICELSDPPAVGEKTIAVDDIEVYRAETNTWETLVEDLPNHRFRFAAVGYDNANAIYAFGGQVAFDESCQCFRTTDSIYTYAAANNVAPGGGGASSASSTSGAFMLLGQWLSYSTLAAPTVGLLLLAFI